MQTTTKSTMVGKSSKTKPEEPIQAKRKSNEIIVNGTKYTIDFEQLLRDYYSVSQHHLAGQAAWRALSKVLNISYEEARDLTIRMRE